MSRVGIRGQQRLLRHHLESLLAVRPLERLYAGHARGEHDERVLIRQLLPNIPVEQRAETATLFAEHLERLDRLTAPGTLPIREHVTEEDGPFYLVTDAPSGTTLGELVQNAGSLPTATTAAIGAALADLLGHAHARGVIHAALRRDLVLVQTDGTLTIMDLGLVPMLLDRTGGRLRRVHAAWDSLFPEPAAVAPEVLSGDTISARTDVYGLGILLHLMATAQAPYDGRAVVVYNAILSSQREVDPAEQMPDIDPRLADIIRACLRRDPEARPATTTEVREQLLELTDDSVEEALSGFTAALDDREYTERFRPLLRVVRGGDDDPHAAASPAADGVVPLFADGPPMSEAELIANMSAEQRAIYFAGSTAMEQGPSRRTQTRRGIMLGLLLTALLLALMLPHLMDPTATGPKGRVVIDVPALPTRLAEPDVRRPRADLETGSPPVFEPLQP